MRRVHSGGDWTFFCPKDAPGLNKVYGRAFDALYEQYEKSCRGRRKVPARDVWEAIMVSQVETGGPFMLYKDACNGMCMVYRVIIN